MMCSFTNVICSYSERTRDRVSCHICRGILRHGCRASRTCCTCLATLCWPWVAPHDSSCPMGMYSSVHCMKQKCVSIHLKRELWKSNIAKHHVQ